MLSTPALPSFLHSLQATLSTTLARHLPQTDAPQADKESEVRYWSPMAICIFRGTQYVYDPECITAATPPARQGKYRGQTCTIQSAIAPQTTTTKGLKYRGVAY